MTPHTTLMSTPPSTPVTSETMAHQLVAGGRGGA
jgi:hypothetical protein